MGEVVAEKVGVVSSTNGNPQRVFFVAFYPVWILISLYIFVFAKGVFESFMNFVGQGFG